MIDLYAITDTVPAQLEGLDAVRGDGLVALCGPATNNDDLTAGVLWRHEEIVEALMEQCDLLPVRFGTRVEDEQAAARVLVERRSELTRALERVRGAVELSVRIFSAREGDDGPPAAGAEYLRWRTERERERLAVRARIHRALVLIARDSHEHAAQDPHELTREAYLVDRDRVEEFVERVVELEAANLELRLLCTGPWPPYSFTRS